MVLHKLKYYFQATATMPFINTFVNITEQLQG